MDAVGFYQHARDCKGVSLRYQNDGREWLTRTWAMGLAWESCLVAARDWIQHAESPVERIRAADWQIEACLQLGQLEEARRIYKDLLAAMEILAAAPSKEGIQVKKTLDRMKAPKRLAKAPKTLQ